MESYMEAKVVAKAMGEANDCAVIATAICLNLPYAAVHSAYEEVGRRCRAATPLILTFSVFDRFGYKLEPLNGCHPYRRCKTVKTLNKKIVRGDIGNYLVLSTGHLAAIKGGKVQDWSSNARKRIVRIYSVEKL